MRAPLVVILCLGMVAPPPAWAARVEPGAPAGGAVPVSPDGAADGDEGATREAAASDLDPQDAAELEEARALFETGVAHYEAAEYGRAIEVWFEALSLVPRTYENRKIRAELIYNIATAQEKSYDIGKDIENLRRARRSLERFLAEIDKIYPEDEAASERAGVQERIARLDGRIAAAEEEARRLELEKAERMRPKFDPVVDAREHRRNRALLATGGVLTGLGVAGLAVMGAGLGVGKRASADLAGLESSSELAHRRDVQRRGRLGNTLALSGVVVGGAALLIGVPMLIAGAVFEHRRREYRASFAFGPSGVGVRF